jgi:hypothetical protein
MLSVGSRCTRLLKIKKDLEDQNTIDRIRDILMPREFTRVDGIVDLVFRTAKEIKQDEIEAFEDGEDRSEKEIHASALHDGCNSRFQVYLGETLAKQTAAIYATPDGTTGRPLRGLKGALPSKPHDLLVCFSSRSEGRSQGFSKGASGLWLLFGTQNTRNPFTKVPHLASASEQDRA